MDHNLWCSQVALMEGMAFAASAFGPELVKPDYNYIASAVFCQPPLGTVRPPNLHPASLTLRLLRPGQTVQCLAHSELGWGRIALCWPVTSRLL